MFGIALRGNCWFSTLGVLYWRGVFGRGYLESYRSPSKESSVSEARIDEFVALLGVGAKRIGSNESLPIPARVRRT